MVSRRWSRFVLPSLGAVFIVLAQTTGVVLAGEPGDCVVRVAPRAAPAGTAFVFSGDGFTPTELELQKIGSDPISLVLDLGDDPEWEVTVRSHVGDEGTWSATFHGPDCDASIDFRVTLSNTDMISDILSPTAGHPLLLYVLVVTFGFGGGILLARRFGLEGRA